MYFKKRFYIILSLSFLLLFISFYLNIKSTQETEKFSENSITLATQEFKGKIEEFKKSKERTQYYSIFIFLLAFILIFLSIHKFALIFNKLKNDLLHAKKAEEELKKLQEHLTKSNDELALEIAKKTQEIHNKMYKHSITGLANRNKLLEDIYQYDFRQMALLNIDKFQKFNDVYGENIGNRALMMSGEFLKKYINDNTMHLYHIGGDEFVFAANNYTNMYDDLFVQKIEKIISDFEKQSFFYLDKQFSFNITAGLAFSGRKKMLAYADMALKEAKQKNIHISVYNDDEGLEKLHKEDIECHKKLLLALETDNVVSFFQPIIPLQDITKSTKYESLVRIKSEYGKIIPPFNFINVAKRNRIYDKLTEVIINNTLFVASKYQVSVSINISMEDIYHPKTLHLLYKKFENYPYNHLLTIELLESEEIKDYKRVHEFCKKIHSYGIKIALDDFGAGYSNFSHILNLPVDFIKIDASLISNIDTNENSRLMVETIVGLAKRLGVETIAEFVSSKKILDVVTSLRVDYAQGYHMGKPEPIETYLSEAINL